MDEFKEEFKKVLAVFKDYLKADDNVEITGNHC